ncbi:MAG: HAMP domain-containing sensor histidine kinase [Eggerthellaceae bacterium]|nr:HAMP domain-containing sensor histidine kinase [Eggerthellaceae bacterium]
MLRKLRIKFIALNMALAALVLLVAFGMICRIDYQGNYDDLQTAVRNARINVALSESEQGKGGANPDALQKDVAPDEQADEQAGGQAAAPDEQTDNQTAGQANTQKQSTVPPRIGKGGDDDLLHIPVAVYRVFSDGSYEAMGARSTATISDDTASAAVAYVTEQAKNSNASGLSGEIAEVNLLYDAFDAQQDSFLVAFADTSYLSSTMQLARTLAVIGFATLLAFLVINVFFSRWALRPVERAWAQQRQFVADASHELKTPLTVILANTAILRAHADDTVGNQSQWVESTQAEAERMQGLVNDMLELAQLDSAATSERVFGEVDFTDLVENYVLQFESVAFERGIAIESDLAPHVRLRGDEKRLERLASTLIDNACKYSNDGGKVHVALSVGGNGREARLVVRNSGDVIPPDDLPHVFDRFYRADRARTRNTNSYGLGLAIAQEVAKEHGGSITAESNEREGTTFTATLPIK